MKTTRLLRYGYLFVALGAVLVFSMAISAPAAEKEVVLGAIIPLSGPAAPWGIGLQNVWKMQFDQINAAGGMRLGGETYKWRLAAYDSAMDPSKAASAMTRLVSRDKARFVMILDGALVMACQPISEPAKTIVVALATPGRDYINKEHFYTFAYGPDVVTNIPFYSWLSKNTDVKKVAILQPDNWTGNETAVVSRIGAEKANLDIIFDELGDYATTDFFPVLTRCLPSKPDFLEISAWDAATFGLIVKQARELGFKGHIHVYNPDIPSLKEVAGMENLENVFLDPFCAEPTPKMKSYQDDYIQRYGEEQWPGSVAYCMYDYPPWFTQAIEATQSLDTTRIVNYLENAKLVSMWGEPTWMGGMTIFGIRRMPIYPLYISLVQNGKFVQAVDKMIPGDF